MIEWLLLLAVLLLVIELGYSLYLDNRINRLIEELEISKEQLYEQIKEDNYE